MSKRIAGTKWHGTTTRARSVQKRTKHTDAGYIRIRKLRRLTK